MLHTSDLTVAVRLIRKQPLLSLAAILALTIGVGLATTAFTLLEAVHAARLPFEGGERFVLLDAYRAPEASRETLEDERFDRLRVSAPALQHLGAYGAGPGNLRLPSGEVALARSVRITAESFSVLPYRPLLGRALTADDGVPGAAPVVVLRESLWRRHFSADPAAIGRAAELDGEPHTIVGVLPDEAEFPNSPDAWVAIRDVRDARVFGVLAPGRTVEVAGAQLAAASAQYEAENRAATPLRLDLVPFAEALSRGLDVLMASLVFALVLVVLVIAANVGNLVLARTLSRTTELAIRASLGATRTRLVGQIAAEALVLGAIASAAGVLASQEALRWARLTLTDMPFWVDLTAGPWTMAFVVGVTLLTTAVAGAWPALRATRADTARTMAAGSGRTSIGFGRFSTAVIAAQVALSIGALHAALVVAHGVAGYMADVPLPAQWQVVTAKVNAPDTVGTRAAYSAVLDALQRRPDVAAAGLATSLPRLSPPTVVTTVRAGASGAGSERRAAPSVAVSRGFLESLGATPVRGRLFIAGDFEPDAPPVAIVNEPFVAKFLAGADPVGWQLAAIDEQTGAPGPWREVVGVVPDLGLSAGDAAYAAGFYVPMGDESFTYLSVATRGDVAPFVDGLRTMVADVEPRLTIREVMPLHEVGAEDRAVFAGIGTAIMALGGVALLLSVLGVYAMLSFSVTRRQRELAIRTALGATPRHLLGSLVGRTLLPLSLGVLAGPLLGAGLVALRGIFAFRLPAEAGPWAAPALGALVLIAGLIAAWVPARRSLQVTTSDALRAD